MINIESARNFLNKVSPKIREYWEKTNHNTLAHRISEIEHIEKKKGDVESKIRNQIWVSVSIFAGLTFFIIAIFSTTNIYYMSLLLVAVMAVVVALHCFRRSILSDRLNEYEQSQETIYESIKKFWDTVLKVSENYTLPSDKSVDEEYIKDVLIGDIEDLLLKKAMYGARRNNPNIDLDNEVLSALAYNKADLHLDTRWKIVTDELGVNLNKKEMFIETAKEMRKTYPALSEYFIVE